MKHGQQTYHYHDNIGYIRNPDRGKDWIGFGGDTLAEFGGTLQKKGGFHSIFQSMSKDAERSWWGGEPQGVAISFKNRFEIFLLTGSIALDASFVLPHTHKSAGEEQNDDQESN
jgi:hypothetical protein